MDISQYKTLFLQETEEHLKGISDELLHLENTPHDSAITDNLFRHFHSIKGMAASMGYEALSSLSHRLEDLLDALRKKRIPISQEIMDALFNGSDILRTYTKMIADDKPLDIDTTALLSSIHSLLIKKEASPVMSSSKPAESASPPPARPDSQKLGLPTTMKVDSKVLDNLIGTTGELFTVASHLKDIAIRSNHMEFKEAAHKLGRTIEDIYHTIIAARMIPFGDLTQNLPRIVRDMCKKAQKDAELLLQGADVRLDRAVLEYLSDPLVHMIRNAIDHGIETTGERVRLGKTAKGRITIHVARERDTIVIEITDDGKGIDKNKLKEKAQSSGIPAEKTATMSDKDLLLLICLPGLSLAEKVTETSGRGVGMDVVKRNVEFIGGRLDISSYPNKGTTITLELPVTISIIKVLLISLGDELFSLPISKVIMVTDVEKTDIQHDTSPPYFIYNNETRVPLIDLRNLLHMPPRDERNFFPVVVIDAKDKLSGIIVDDFEGEIDAYIKPLSLPAARIKGIIGTTVLGDGRPVFLLDPTALIT